MNRIDTGAHSWPKTLVRYLAFMPGCDPGEVGARMAQSGNEAHAGIRLGGFKTAAWKLAALAAGLAVVTFYFAGRSDRTEDITNIEYGERWPWPTQPSATLHCHLVMDQQGQTLPVVLVTMGGEVYGLSGLAIQTSGWPDSRQMMERDENGAYLGRARKDIIERGKKLCVPPPG